MNLDFLPLLMKRLDETAEHRTSQMVAAGQRLALETLRDAGGDMTMEAFMESWEVMGVAMLKDLEAQGWAVCEGGRIRLTLAGGATLQG